MNIINRITPYNFSNGRYGVRVDKVVLHTIVGTLDSAENRFHSAGVPASRAASCHYGVGLSGQIRRWVAEGDTAWQAGNWDTNVSSIGIEHEDNGNYNDGVRTDALYNASIALVTDICRRYGLSADRVHVHNEFRSTACPDGLDVGRIRTGVALALAGIRQPAPSEPAHIEDIPFTPESTSVTISVETLLVRDRPTTLGSTSGMANTPDGALHSGNQVTITGHTVGNDPFGDGRNVWLRSARGNWFWAGGTDYLKPISLATPVIAVEPVTPENITDYTPVEQQITVTGDGLAVRTAPSTGAPLNGGNTAGGRLAAGTVITVTGYKQGEVVEGNDIWLRSQFGNWLWSGGTNFSLPAPAAAEVPAEPVILEPVAPEVPVQADYVATFEPEAKLVVAADDTEMVDFAGQKPSVLVRKGVRIQTTGTFTHDGKSFYRYISQKAENATAFFGIPQEDAAEPVAEIIVPSRPASTSLDGIRTPERQPAPVQPTFTESQVSAWQPLVAILAAGLGRIGALLDIPFSIVTVLVKRKGK